LSAAHPEHDDEPPKAPVAELKVPQAAFAATISGTLAEGGGVDDMHIVVKAKSGKEVYAFCAGQCGKLFTAPDKNEQSFLQKKYVGKPVVLTYASEKNKDRIAGAGEDGPLLFVKKLEFAK
jgi:hypothetical protein